MRPPGNNYLPRFLAWAGFASLSIALVACSRGEAPSPAARSATTPRSSASRFLPQVPVNVGPVSGATSNNLAGPNLYYGLCDASAVVALSDSFFVVGDDEDNILRVYQRFGNGIPVAAVNLNSFLRIDPKAPEVDIEGADPIGDRIYWISSHGRNAKGKFAPNRHRFFATTALVTNGLVRLQTVGRPYSGLLQDLFNDPRLAPFNLPFASSKAPKAPGALNIEGLSATPEGHLLIGFRNPIPRGKALIVPLLNPAEVIEGVHARFGEPILLDLDGRGIRSMTMWYNEYLIVAGSSQEGGRSRLYLWDGKNPPRWIQSIEVGGLNPEAISFWDKSGQERLYIVSDDGTVNIGGVPCKKLKSPSLKHFRALCINP